MLKTIKLGALVLLAAVFLSACTSGSTKNDTDQTDTGTIDAPTSSGSSSTDVGSTVVEQPTVEVPALESVFYFDFDQSSLRPDVRAALLAQAAYLKANPQAVRLEGHADERGTREYNMALGERRALAIRDFLRFEGVNSAIEVVSYGEESPAVFGSGESAWQQNRRVELK